MEVKNDSERGYIKEAFIKLYNSVMPYVDSTQFDDARIAFNELDNKVDSEIYILKKCLAERDRAVDAGLTRSEVLQERINDLEQRLNNERKHGEDLADVNGQLASENADLKAKTGQLRLLEHSRITWRGRAQHAEKEVEDLNKKISDLEKELTQARNSTELHLRQENDRLRVVVDTLEKEINTLKKKIHELEEENANLRVTPSDAIRIKSLERANKILRRENGTLWTTLEKRDIGERTCYESLSETIEFQNKKIEELEVEKTRLKENVDLSYGHEFEFGDKVFVPWSYGPYMYVKCGMMYNPRTQRLVYVGKTQHLKWFGERFEIK